tara:strand:- start:494 stop:1711 length:1218 start_codon:yes stop_codon:yes gene_type:complete
MSIKILMPSLSPTMKEGLLQKWLIKKGDNVKAGDILAEIETDKATMEIEAVDEGVITDILVKEGTEGVPINTPIAILNGNIEDKEEEKKISKKKTLDEDIKIENNEIEQNEKKSQNKKNLQKNKEVIYSPFAKKIAKDKNIDLNKIIGSGPEGRIIKRDLDDYSDENLSSNNNDSFEPSSIRKIIADKTTKTKNTVPHFYLSIESQVDKLLKLRKIINDQNENNKISINDILVKALALAQKRNPETNVSWQNDKIIKFLSVDVSIAVALDEGLVTPIIRKADTKGLLEISREIRSLITKSKNGKLLPDEYTGGTISISNLGMYGITEFSAIINPPQSSILAVGTIQKKIILENEELNEIKIIKSTLSADHRVLDGSVAAKLLKDFSDIIENPFSLWLESNDMEIL